MIWREHAMQYENDGKEQQYARLRSRTNNKSQTVKNFILLNSPNDFLDVWSFHLQICQWEVDVLIL